MSVVFTPGYNQIKSLYENAGRLDWADRIKPLQNNKPLTDKKKVALARNIIGDIFKEIADQCKNDPMYAREAMPNIMAILKTLRKGNVDHTFNPEYDRISKIKDSKAKEDEFLKLFMSALTVRLCTRLMMPLFKNDGVEELTPEKMKQNITDHYNERLRETSSTLANNGEYQEVSRMVSMMISILMQLTELFAVDMGHKPPSAYEDKHKHGHGFGGGDKLPPYPFKP